MANFNTHITTSAMLGIGYGAVGHTVYDMPLPASILASGLCTVAGILPDVDADRGHSLREIMAFLAAVIPMLLLDRFRHLGLPHETTVLFAAFTYLFVRFGLTKFIQKYTVHRGMWHSIPAAATAGLVTFWLCHCPELRVQLYKAGAVVAGFMWHLLLDEIYAVQATGGRVRMKKSFGTALKMFSKSPWANISTYGKLFVMIAIVMNERNALQPAASTTPQPEVHSHQLELPFELSQPQSPPPYTALEQATAKPEYYPPPASR